MKIDSVETVLLHDLLQLIGICISFFISLLVSYNPSSHHKMKKEIDTLKILMQQTPLEKFFTKLR